MDWHIAKVVIRGGEAWVPYRRNDVGELDVYTVAVHDLDGAEALLTVLQAGGPVASRVEFMQRWEMACADDPCTGHTVTQLGEEEVRYLEQLLERARDRRLAQMARSGMAARG